MGKKVNDAIRSTSFYKAASGMHRNPLGLIALFIVSVYGIGALALGLGKPEFYAASHHPVVLFMALFPVAVLLVFFLLVAFFHTHLYGPGDYDDQTHFFWNSMPKELRGYQSGVATSGSETPVAHSDADALDGEYQRMISFGFILLHETQILRTRTTPRSGLFGVRVWVEPFDPENSLSEIESVTYRVWEDFPKRILASSDQKSSFQLFLKIYGEFPVLALVRKKNGETFQLMRHLDLPGRPMD